MGGYYFWDSGLANGNNIAMIYGTSTALEELQKSNDLDKITPFIKQGKIREAYQRFDHLKQRISDINRTKSFEHYYKSLQQDMLSVSNSFDKLLAFPQISKIFEVFTTKLLKFNKFSSRNNWQRLTQTSLQISLRLKNLKHYHPQKISRMEKSILKDLDRMEMAATSSRLSSLDKHLIVGRLKKLHIEIKILGKYIDNIGLFERHYKQFNISYKRWVKHMVPEISREKAMISHKGRKFGLFLLTLFSLATIFFIGNIWVYRKHWIKVDKLKEEYALDIIRNKLLVTQPDLSDESIEFQKEFKKGHRYIHKRMSFGSIFQNTFPFGAILLDSNLKIIWANHIFCDSWGINKIQIDQESINWDFVCRLTNLGDNDPIQDALDGSFSGIYQIRSQIKFKDHPVPFEMYVNPVEYAGQKRILVFFYPLTALEQVMEEHSASIMTPIEKSLEVLISGNLLNGGREEFSMVGMEHIFERLQFLSKSLNTERHNHGEEMARTKAELRYYQKTLGDIQRWQRQAEDIQQKYRQSLINLREDIICLSEDTGTQYTNIKSIIVNLKNVMKNHLEIIGLGQFFYDEIQRLQKAVSGLMKLREVFRKLPRSAEDKNLQKTLKTLDVIFSKIELIFEMDKINERVEKLQWAEENFRNFQKEFNTLVSDSKSISTKMNDDEAKVIRDIKQMYQTTIQMGRSLQQLEEFLIDDEERVHLKHQEHRSLTTEATS